MCLLCLRDSEKQTVWTHYVNGWTHYVKGWRNVTHYVKGKIFRDLSKLPYSNAKRCEQKKKNNAGVGRG